MPKEACSQLSTRRVCINDELLIREQRLLVYYLALLCIKALWLGVVKAITDTDLALALPEGRSLAWH